MDISTQRVAETVRGVASNIEKVATIIERGDENADVLASDISDLSFSISAAQRALTGMMDGVAAARSDAYHSSEIMTRLEIETERIGAAIEAVVEGSDAVHLSNERILEVTANLETRVVKVDSVIEVIRNIAERTRLLSVNASIMASEAGEHGRAFTVVAREIKDLAKSTAGAISEISRVVAGLKEDFALTIETIKWGQKDVDRGVGLARDAVVLLHSIPGKVHEASELNSEIVRWTENQVENGTQVETIINRLAVVLEQVEQLLKAQVERNLGAIETFGNMRLVTDQLNASTRKQSLSSSELSQKVEGINNQLVSLARGIEKHASDSSHVIQLYEVGFAAVASSEGPGEDMVGLLKEIEQLAEYLEEDFGKLTGKRA
jgi:methyl-accepting chemotaxis protein